MSKQTEPSKDFRQAMRVALASRVMLGDGLLDEATDKVLALCKDMLVPDASGYEEWGLEVGTLREQGWDACRSELLKRMGEDAK